MNVTRRMNERLIHVLPMTAMLAAMLCFTACRSAHEPGGASHAVVQISGRSLDEVQQATTAVFGEEGYSVIQRSPDAMVFARPGSRREAAKYGSWSGDGVTMRVRVAFSALANSGYRLQADVYSQQNANDPFFSDESRVMMVNRLPYQRMLDEVADRLK